MMKYICFLRETEKLTLQFQGCKCQNDSHAVDSEDKGSESIFCAV